MHLQGDDPLQNTCEFITSFPGASCDSVRKHADWRTAIWGPSMGCGWLEPTAGGWCPFLRLVTCFFRVCDLWCPATRKRALAGKRKIMRGVTLGYPKVVSLMYTEYILNLQTVLSQRSLVPPTATVSELNSIDNLWFQSIARSSANNEVLGQKSRQNP